MRDQILHILKYGIILGSAALLTGCVSTPRVPLQAFNHENYVYLSYVDKRPVKPEPVVHTNSMKTAGWEDVVTVLPDVLEAYRDIEVGTRVISIELFIADSNKLSEATMAELLKAFREVTNK